ncbi:hypothetical protein KAH94_04320 [bacterium]|nr:hypothetical protein [bacterium]
MIFKKLLLTILLVFTGTASCSSKTSFTNHLKKSNSFFAKIYSIKRFIYKYFYLKNTALIKNKIIFDVDVQEAKNNLPYKMTKNK